MTITDTAAIKRLLGSGKTVAQTMDITGWPRRQIISLITQTGWILNTDTDTVAIRTTQAAPEGSHAGVLDLTSRLLRELSRLERPGLTRPVGRARDALTALEEALTGDVKRLAAEADVAAAEQALADAKARLKELTTAKAPARSSDGPTAAEIRAWAKANGVECSTTGGIAQDVRDAYAIFTGQS